MMVDFFKELLLHFSFILFLGFLYNFIYTARKIGSRHYLFLLSNLGVILLTMLFPVHIQANIEFDLKLIPFFITFFYLGPLFSLVPTLFILVLQSFIDFQHVFPTMINYTILFIVLLAFKSVYQNGSLTRKVSIGLIIYFFVTTTRMALVIQADHYEQIPYLLLFSLVSFFALAVTVFIIEMTVFRLQALKELQKAETLQVVNQLAASVAHEIRNPMTTIKGFMQIMQHEKNLTEDQKMFVITSLKELDRTQTVINNFLSLAKPNMKRKEHINLSTLLAEIVAFMRPFASLSGIELKADIAENLFVRGDPHEVRQLIINLIKNGIEAMPDGGSFHICASLHGSHILIEIKDEGIGMTQKQIDRLGQPYYSMKEKGTGLGMMICMDIIKRMDGELMVSSEPGRGTTMTIKVPGSDATGG